MDKKNIFLSGLSQGGTTLLLSLFDGQPDILAYPDESSFQRLFERYQYYHNSKHYLCDAIFGTPNPLGLGSEFGIPLKKRQKLATPGVGCAEVELENLNQYKIDSLISVKRIRGLENYLSGESHFAFFRKYFTTLIDRSDFHYSNGPKSIRAHHFEALRSATAEIELPVSLGGVQVCKQPISSLSSTAKFDLLVKYVRSHDAACLVFIERDRYPLFSSRLQYYAQRCGVKRIRLLSHPRAFTKIANSTRRDVGVLGSIKKKYEGSKDIIFLNYEELVTQTNDVLGELFSRIHLDYDARASSPTKLGLCAQLPTDRTGSVGKGVSQASVTRWQQEMTLAEKVAARVLLR